MVDSERNLPSNQPQPRVLVPNVKPRSITPTPIKIMDKKVPSMLDNQLIIKRKLNEINFHLSEEKYMCITCDALHKTQKQAVIHQFMEHEIKGINLF